MSNAQCREYRPDGGAKGFTLLVEGQTLASRKERRSETTGEQAKGSSEDQGHRCPLTPLSSTMFPGPVEQISPEKLRMLASATRSSLAADRGAMVVHHTEFWKQSDTPTRCAKAQAEVEILAIEKEALIQGAHLLAGSAAYGESCAGYPLDS